MMYFVCTEFPQARAKHNVNALFDKPEAGAEGSFSKAYLSPVVSFSRYFR